MKDTVPAQPQTRRPESPHTRRALLKGLALIGFSAALPAHAATSRRKSTSEYPQLIISTQDYRFKLPERISAGYTEVTLKNAGPAEHHAMFMRLNPGKTLADFMAIAQNKDVGALFSISSSIGGPGSVDPGHESTVVIDLTPGQYVVICIVPAADGMPHYKMGMLAPLTVTASARKSRQPAATVTADLIDFSFEGMAQTLHTGRQIWKVTDTGKQLHELVLNRIAPGATFEKIVEILKATPPDSLGAPAGPPPFTAVAGVAPMSPGETNWAVLDLEPADYFAICFVPDIKTGKPHFALGMIMPFTVKPRSA